MASAGSTQMAPESERGKRKIPRSGVQKPANTQNFAIPLKFHVRGSIPVITVTPVHSHSKSRKKGHLVVNIPKMQNVCDKKIKITENDRCLTPEWTEFVIEHLTSIVENCISVADFEKWSVAIDEITATFLLNFMWIHANKTSRFWRIDKSKVKIDKTWWYSAASAGSGLFCTRAGRHEINFGMNPETRWVQKEPERNCQRERFGLGPNVFKRINGKNIKGWCVPSDLSLQTGLIHHGFKVNFVKKAENPTHELKFENGRYYLSPLRLVTVGEEFTYDYGYCFQYR